MKRNPVILALLAACVISWLCYSIVGLQRANSRLASNQQDMEKRILALEYFPSRVIAIEDRLGPPSWAPDSPEDRIEALETLSRSTAGILNEKLKELDLKIYRAISDRIELEERIEAIEGKLEPDKAASKYLDQLRKLKEE